MYDKEMDGLGKWNGVIHNLTQITAVWMQKNRLKWKRIIKNFFPSLRNTGFLLSRNIYLYRSRRIQSQLKQGKLLMTRSQNLLLHSQMPKYFSQDNTTNARDWKTLLKGNEWTIKNNTTHAVKWVFTSEIAKLIQKSHNLVSPAQVSRDSLIFHSEI